MIANLNQIKFGDGHLSAEFKKDRDEEQVITPDDIDPLTLYVGNLAQDVTKEDVHKRYPKNRRIDIGYAKKMKYTRYAFVSFFNVEDSIEAFRTTRCTEMHAKSMIVRFRRYILIYILHLKKFVVKFDSDILIFFSRLKGTVGMPGESKQQNPPRSRADMSTSLDDSISRSPDEEFPSLLGDMDYSDYYYEEEDYNNCDSKERIFSRNIEGNICNEILAQENGTEQKLGPPVIKQELPFDITQPPPPPPPPETEELDIKPDISNMPLPPLFDDTEVSINAFKLCRPKVEVKKEDGGDDKGEEPAENQQTSPNSDLFANVQIKTEPESGKYKS